MCFDLEWQCHIAGAKSQIGSSVQRRKSVLKFHSKAQNVRRHARDTANLNEKQH